MPKTASDGLTRRHLLAAASGIATLAALPPLPALAASAAREVELKLAPAKAPLVGEAYPETEVWAFNGSIPGPLLRARQGERLRIRVVNALAEETAVHWHGLRIPNAMDGVPHLTQHPIAPGESFVYDFAPPDAGTYWYHPHQRSFEQVGRGLYGPLIVEEAAPPAVDRELVWMLDDWRLQPDAQIAGDFGNMMDVSHAGRIGNTVTLNGRLPENLELRGGERLRLRLINAANARIFGLAFAGHRPLIVAIDGQPVPPHAPPGDLVVLAPAMRIDLLLDAVGAPGERHQVTDRFYKGREYRLLDLAYAAEPLRREALPPPAALPANALPEPDLERAEQHQVVFAGGMMGGMTGAMFQGRHLDIREMMHNGKVWAINGVAADGHMTAPLLTLERGASYRLELVNDTAWPHPIHLHGHSFRVVTRNGAPTAHREWQDTVLLPPRERAEIAFVADNPGDWMFHCHILEHQAGGMMGVIRVT